MKIYFCDLCNESVPQGDLEHGKAVMRNGRVICRACEDAMSAEEGVAKDPVSDATPGGASSADRPPVAAGSRGGGQGLAVGLASLALLIAVGGTAFLVLQSEERFQGFEDRLQSVARDTRDEGRAIRTDLSGGLDRATTEVAQLRTDLAETRARLGEATQGHKEQVQALRADLARLDDRTRELDGLLESSQRTEREVSRLRDIAAGLRNEIVTMGRRLDAAPTQPASAEIEPAPLIGIGGGAGAEEPRPEWWPLVADLANDSSGARWQAVTKLGQTKDAAVAEHLIPMLKDEDIFVRMATARILGDLEAPDAIPALIEALEDAEAAVREASVVSLRGVTGQNFRFDPSGKEADRTKRVKSWRDWWAKSSEDFVGK